MRVVSVYHKASSPVDVNLELDEMKRKKHCFIMELLHSTDMGGTTVSVETGVKLLIFHVEVINSKRQVEGKLSHVVQIDVYSKRGSL